MKAVKLTKEPFICLHVSIEFRHFKGCFDRTQTINQKTFWILKLINVSVDLLPSVNTNVEPDVTVWLIDLFLIVFWKTLSSMTQRNTIYQAFDIHSTCRWWLFFILIVCCVFFNGICWQKDTFPTSAALSTIWTRQTENSSGLGLAEHFHSSWTLWILHWFHR